MTPSEKRIAEYLEKFSLFLQLYNKINATAFTIEEETHLIELIKMFKLTTKQLESHYEDVL